MSRPKLSPLTDAERSMPKIKRAIRAHKAGRLSSLDYLVEIISARCDAYNAKTAARV